MLRVSNENVHGTILYTVLRIMYQVCSYQSVRPLSNNTISEYSQESKGSITMHAEESVEPDRRTRFMFKEKSERI